MGMAKQKGGLGYRDLEHFNMALLAKQGWKMMLKPNSLVAQVLKSKYFSKESFITSRLGSNPSYVWRSLWGAKYLVQAGMFWRVGDSKSIKIWGDKWVESTSTGKIQAPVRLLGENAKVSALIDDTTHWWNYELIREIFPEEEAKRIYSMAISSLGKADQLVWAGTKKGIFTVRSAYHMAKELAVVDKGECSDARSKERMWQIIWKLNCPRVIQLFLWKACNNILPTKENIFRRAVTLDDKCPICTLEQETIEHSLWSCPVTKDVWMMCPPRIHKSPSDEVDFSTIFVCLVERLSVEELRMLGFVARQIWLRRNDVVFNGNLKSPERIVQAARLQMEQFDQASACKITDKSTMGNNRIRTHVRWMKPPVRAVKINWDAALNERTGVAGLGVIARDHEGRTVAMQCSSFKHINNPTTAKTLAAWKSVVLGVQLGVIYMELEGDAKEVVQGMNCASNSARRDGSVLNDIKTLLHNFNTWKVTYINRRANWAAHSLARLALSVRGDHIWFENFPLSVQEIVSAEQAQVMN